MKKQNCDLMIVDCDVVLPDFSLLQTLQLL